MPSTSGMVNTKTSLLCPAGDNCGKDGKVKRHEEDRQNTGVV